MTFTNKTYDVLKWIAQICLPALATLYFSLASIWGLPYVEQIIGTITAVDTLLGILLGISTANYKGDGTLVINTGLGNEEISMEAEFDEASITSMADVIAKDSVTLKVKTISG